MIHELLGTGAGEAKTSKELAKVLNMETREIRYRVRVERLAGHLICTNGKGYFLPADISEVNYTISRLYKQARENRKVAQAMQEARDKRIE